SLTVLDGLVRDRTDSRAASYGLPPCRDLPWGRPGTSTVTPLTEPCQFSFPRFPVDRTLPWHTIAPSPCAPASPDTRQAGTSTSGNGHRGDDGPEPGRGPGTLTPAPALR